MCKLSLPIMKIWPCVFNKLELHRIKAILYVISKYSVQYTIHGVSEEKILEVFSLYQIWLDQIAPHLFI